MPLPPAAQAFLERLSTPEGTAAFRKESDDAERRRKPGVTQEELDAGWEAFLDLYGR